MRVQLPEAMNRNPTTGRPIRVTITTTDLFVPQMERSPHLPVRGITLFPQVLTRTAGSLGDAPPATPPPFFDLQTENSRHFRLSPIAARRLELTKKRRLQGVLWTVAR